MRSWPLFALLTGCSFSSHGSPPVTGDDMPMPDSAIDGVPGDARLCFGTGFGATCLPAAPTMPRVLPAMTFDTGGGMCTHVLMITGVETCVLAGTTISLPSNQTFRANGMRPLVLVASESITIDGAITTSSLRGQPRGAGSPSSLCVAPTAADNDSGGGGGGAGGSFGGRGGNGGTGDLNNSGAPAGTSNGGVATASISSPVLTIRAGCPGLAGGNGVGNGGNGGAGGGAMYLIAGTQITINGVAFSVGAGGSGGVDEAGGGGGGTGGLIAFDAPMVAVNGSVMANGGGGGEGAGNSTVGGNGGDGATNGTARAAGGSGGDTGGGNGGQGSGNGNLSGDVGSPQDGGGGGGGGGAGYIYIKGALSGSGTISPAPN